MSSCTDECEQTQTDTKVVFSQYNPRLSIKQNIQLFLNPGMYPKQGQLINLKNFQIAK